MAPRIFIGKKKQFKRGETHPIKNITVIILMIIMLRYSAIKIKVKNPPIISGLNPKPSLFPPSENPREPRLFQARPEMVQVGIKGKH